MDIVKAVGAHQSETLGAGVFQPTWPGQANCIVVQALVQNVRFTMDGSTDPTASTGFLLTAGDPPTLIPCYINGDVRFLRSQNGAILEYQYGISED